ncbi:flavin-containing monooxygenase [Kutzneria albida]|uniref:Monooxygenase n=1 Tax=Kutzneria albida DSM 43870 TaxID=1449976 RepID=W5W3C7_9PSEU|nr:NAD(P)/FAD-dependent oxidoreductase [Kutzneria albida]AHH95285.1 monooxygenase [Kutzneria albida DSM 43870]
MGQTPEYEVVVVGAGFGGLGAAIALRAAGLTDFVILERAADIGGTWRDNTYPDVAVDLPSFTYQFSFAPNPRWSRVFPKGAEVKAYIDHLADRYQLRQHLRLNTEMTAREWDEVNHLWRLHLGDGSVLTARFVLTALGAFVDPKRPDLPGLAEFTGKVVQAARWDHGHDLSGERVAVIGTGSTAVQLVPKVARVASRLTVFQRRAIWVFAKPDLKIPPVLQTLFARVPAVQRAVRAVTSAVVEALLVGTVVLGKPGSVVAKIAETGIRAYLRTQVADPVLRAKLTPDYGFGCKRPSVSNTYYRTYTRPNVDLVTEGIERITATGVRSRDGRLHEVDTLILATGFRLSNDPENYRKVPVRGRDGFDLAQFYAGNKVQAYEGVSIPKLPNSFFIFGPFSWTGSSWHVMVETQSHHAIRVITEARRRGATAVEVSQRANDRFFRFVHRRATGSLIMTNNCTGANTYYIDHHGDFSLLRPTTAWQAWRASRRFSLDDYTYRTVGQ